MKFTYRQPPQPAIPTYLKHGYGWEKRMRPFHLHRSYPIRPTIPHARSWPNHRRLVIDQTPLPQGFIFRLLPSPISAGM